MADNVNINVTENIDQVNIVASEVVEVVDLNLYATTEDVTINVTEEIIQVNINKVTNTGSQTLAETLVFGNITDGTDISISDGDEITFDNGSRIRKGLTDSGNGGAKGVALVCSLDYELKWEAGRLYVMQQDGFTIREVSHNFTIKPTPTDDETKGFTKDSRWILDNGDVYVCADPTEASAIWELQAIDLSGYVPYTGATTNVDLGEFELKAGQVTLDTSPTGTAAVATTRWNNTLGITETTLKGGSVVLKNGIDLVARVVNKVTPNTTLTKANYAAVRISGAQGQRLAVAYAQANNDLNSADTIGLVCETIPTNQEGFILTVGQLENINTTGNLQGENWNDGDVIYLSPTVAGKLTNIKPTAPQHIVIIGYVEYAHANNGKLYVKIMNGWELEELHNVSSTNYTTPIDTDSVLTYDVTNSLWKRLSWSNIKSNLKTYFDTIYQAALGFTPENVANKSTSTSLGLSNTLYPTQNAVKVYADSKVTDAIVDGVTTIAPSQNAVFDALALKQNTLTNPITGTGANGQVAFFNGTTTQTGDNDLFWDNTNKRLGVGINTPSQRLTVFGATTTIPNNSTWITAGNPISSFYGEGASGNMDFFIGGASSIALSRPVLIGRKSRGTLASPTALVNVDSIFSFLSSGFSGTQFINSASINMVVDGVVNTNTVPQSITFETGTNSRTERLRINSSGNVGIGTTSPQSRLDVRAQGALSTDIAFRVRNSADTANLIQVNGAGGIEINSTTQGFLPPRMTTTQRNAITTPAAGLIVYDTTENKHYGYNGTTWNAFY